VINLIIKLRGDGVDVQIQWVPADTTMKGMQLAKAAARYATQEGTLSHIPKWAETQLRSSTWREMRKIIENQRTQQFRVSAGGKYTKAIDAALPGKHTKKLYDHLTRIQATTLAQLRTGHNRLNYFLGRISNITDGICECSEGLETTRHSSLSISYRNNTIVK